MFNMQHYKSIFHIQILFNYFFLAPSIELKVRLQIGERLLIATHLDQSNYLANQKHKVRVNKYNFRMFISFFQVSFRVQKVVHFFKVITIF
jgi:hypothetical protein